MEPVAVGNTNQTMPEFGRVNDVQKLFGVKNGRSQPVHNQG